MLTQKKNGKGTIYFVDENDVIVSKTCTKCNEVKTIDCFAENKQGLGHRRAMCLACKTKDYASTKDYVVRNAKRVKLEIRNGVSGKECTTCGTWKTLDDYAIDKTGLGGKEAKCKKCRSIYGRNLRDNNKEREAERIRKWSIANPDKQMLRKQRRRAREKDLPDNFTKSQMDETFTYFGGCALTGDTTDIHWDHVVPLATGQGGTTFGNMIPLRSDLNRSKNDANIFEWFYTNRERFNLSQARFEGLIRWLADVNGMTIEQYRKYVYECFNNENELGSHSGNKTA
jgi:hypothetical protein